MATCSCVSSGLPCAPAADFAAAPAMLRLYSFVPLFLCQKIVKNSEKKTFSPVFFSPIFTFFLETGQNNKS
jgi:hypothetical protein